jgi:hypothetical protein
MPPECPPLVNGGVPHCANLWGMNRIKAPQLWKKLESSAPPGVLNPVFLGTINDNGVYFGHNDLSRNVMESLSHTGAGAEPQGGNPVREEFGGHGTHVAGTAVGEWGNRDERGIAGVFGNGKVISCNLLPETTPAGVSSLDVLIDCLAHAQSNDAHWVSSNSWGFVDPLFPDDLGIQLLRDSIKQFVCDKGGIFIASAGNGLCRDQPGSACVCDLNFSPWQCSSNFGRWVGVNVSDAGVLPDGTKIEGMKAYPAAFAEELDCVIAVAAITPTDADESVQADELAYFSNWGNAVQTAAPGWDIYSDWWDWEDNPANPWDATRLYGTSMACPHVVGTALLLRNAFPWASSKQLIECITKGSSTDKVLPPSAFYGGDQSAVIGTGVLSAVAAYDCLAAVAARGRNTAYVTCNPDVTYQLRPGSCSDTSFTPAATTSGAGTTGKLYTTYGRPGPGFKVTVTPAGQYPLGRTAVMVTYNTGTGITRSCVTAVTVLPCPVRCRAVRLSANTTANCQAASSALTASTFVDKASLSPGAVLSFSPSGPYPIGTLTVTVNASYPGVSINNGEQAVQSAASCVVTVAAVGGIRSWALSSKALCLYRKAESTQEYCLPASQLFSMTLSGATGCYSSPKARAVTCAGVTAMTRFTTSAVPAAAAAAAALTGTRSSFSSSPAAVAPGYSVVTDTSSSKTSSSSSVNSSGKLATAAVSTDSVLTMEDSNHSNSNNSSGEHGRALLQAAISSTCKAIPASTCTAIPASAGSAGGEAQACFRFNTALKLQRVQVRVDVTDGRTTRSVTSSVTVSHPPSASLPVGAPSSCMGV